MDWINHYMVAFIIGRKQLLYPLTNTIYSLKDLVPYQDLVWAITSAAIFSFCLVMLAKYIIEQDYPWRVWYDERPLVEYWRERLGARE